MNSKHSLYFSFINENIFISLLNNQKAIKTYTVIKKNQIGENLINSVSNLLSQENLDINNIDSVYLRNIHSTWNANRLITLFVKTLSIFANISLFIDSSTKEIADINNNLEDEKEYITNNLKYFKKIANSNEQTPFYNKCPIINI